MTLDGNFVRKYPAENLQNVHECLKGLRFIFASETGPLCQMGADDLLGFSLSLTHTRL